MAIRKTFHMENLMSSAKGRTQILVLSPLVLLTLAHVTACLALLAFRARTGSYPLHAIGFLLYLGVTALSAVGLLASFRYTEAMRQDVRLLLMSLPALTSLILQAALWMTPSLGGATYAPYDPGDSDIVAAFSLFFAVIFSVLAVLYGSGRYWLVAGLAQLLVYLGTYALPHWIRYPSTGMLGVRPAILAQLSGVNGLALGLLWVRNKLLPTRSVSLGIATVIISLAGAWVLFSTIASLPANGMRLGWVSATTMVPKNAWDWTRAAAQGLALASIAATIPSAIGWLIQMKSSV